MASQFVKFCRAGSGQRLQTNHKVPKRAGFVTQEHLKAPGLLEQLVSRFVPRQDFVTELCVTCVIRQCRLQTFTAPDCQNSSALRGVQADAQCNTPEFLTQKRILACQLCSLGSTLITLAVPQTICICFVPDF